MAKVTIEYCGMSGTGETVPKAKQDAARKIEAALSGSFPPFLIDHKGGMALIARDPGMYPRQWGYKVFTPGELGRDLYLDCNYESRSDAIKAAAKHLAQNAGTYEGLERWLTAAEQRDLDGYFAWQAEYAQARTEGLSDEECRERANKARYAH